MSTVAMLRARTLALIEEDFNRWDHKVFGKNWKAIDDLVTHLALMVNDKLDRKYYLSSMDVGQGKSVTIKRFLRTLQATPDAVTECNLRHDQVGVLLCLSTYNEIASFVGPDYDHVSGDVIPGSVLDPKSLFVDVSWSTPRGKELRNGHNKCKQQDAQIIITTHANVENQFTRQGPSRSFWETSGFKYSKGFRLCRIWDESLIPNKPHSITTRDLYAMLAAIDGKVPDGFLTDINELIQKMHGVKHKDLFAMPDLFNQYRVDLEDLVKRMKAIQTRLQDTQPEVETLLGLQIMSGGKVSVRKPNNLQEGEAPSRTAITYQPVIPDDFLPICIADASGSLRETYAGIEKSKGLERLASSRKRCEGHLDVFWYDRGGGKSSWAKHYDKMCELVADIIAEEPNRKQLIIHHLARNWGPMQGRFRSPKEGILRALERNHDHYDTSLLAWLTYGKHYATNEFRDYPVVTLAGTLFKDDAAIEGLHRAAYSFLPSDGEVTKAELDAFNLGEQMHDICQAAGRGWLRKNDDVDPQFCPKGTRINIIIRNRLGIKDQFEEIWPGHRLVTRLSPGSIVADTFVVLEQFAAGARSGGRDVLKLAHARKRMDWKGNGIPARRMQDTVIKSPHYKAKLKELGLIHEYDGKRIVGWRLNPFA
jgi:hypothetical protein